MTNDYRAMCAELVDELEDWIVCDDESEIADTHSMIDRARALLAQTVAEGPTDEELAALMSARFLVNQSASARAIANIGTDEQVAQVRAILDGEAIAYARAVLARWGRPKTPSLKEQALARTDAILNDPNRALLIEVRETLELNRLALEALND